MLDWNYSKTKGTFLNKINVIDADSLVENENDNSITIVQFPERKEKKSGLDTNSFKHSNIDFQEKDVNNDIIGELGEKLVFEFEVRYLENNNRKYLADKIIWNRRDGNNAESYDILSYDIDGNIKYIEVKSTTGYIYNDFFISDRERKFSEENKDHYYLYRIFNLKIKNRNGKCFIWQGNINDQFELIPTNYRVSIKN